MPAISTFICGLLLSAVAAGVMATPNSSVTPNSTAAACDYGLARGTATPLPTAQWNDLLAEVLPASPSGLRVRNVRSVGNVMLLTGKKNNLNHVISILPDAGHAVIAANADNGLAPVRPDHLRRPNLIFNNRRFGQDPQPRLN